MGKEAISQKQAIVIMATFIIGSSAIMGAGLQANQDVWLATFASMAMASLIIPVYGRISKLYPGENVFQIMERLFGKVFGKAISLLFTWYAFHLGALIIRNISEFVRTVSLPETPECVFSFFIIVLVIFAVRGGIELLARFLAIFFPIYILLILIVTLVSIPLFDFNNLKPVLYDGLQPVLNASFGLFSFPFAETVLFLCLMGNLRKNGSSYKVYYASLLIGGTVLLIISVRSVLVLGIPTKQIQNFASYAASRLIKIGSFFQRIEASVAIVFIISGYTKTTVCLFTACKGLSSIFNIKEYRNIAAPIGILMTLLSIIIYNDGAEMTQWAVDIYPYYAIPFQIIIPVIIWITAEIKSKLTGKSNKSKDENVETNKVPSHN